MLAWLKTNIDLFQDVQNCLAQFAAAFSIAQAVGPQLDILGLYIGVNRTVPFQPTPRSSVSFFNIGRLPRGVCFDGTNVWIVNFSDNTVSKLLASTGATIGTYTVGNGPSDVCFDGTNIWTANSTDNTISKLLASTGATIGTYTSSGTQPLNICFAGANVWVTNHVSNAVAKIDTTSGSTVATCTVGSAPIGICFDGTNIWTANFGNGTVSKVLASSASVIATYTVGSGASGPWGIVNEGSHIWVSLYNTGELKQILGSSGALLETVSVSGKPQFLAYDGVGTIYCSNFSFSVDAIQAISTSSFTVTTYSLGSNTWGVAWDGTSLWTSMNDIMAVAKLTPNIPVSPILDDSTYRTVLTARIFYNHWNGQIDSLQGLWAQLFPGGSIAIQDNQDMTATIILGGLFTSIITDLIENGYVVPKPQGVRYTFVFPQLPMLGYDRNDGTIAGWDQGHYL